MRGLLSILGLAIVLLAACERERPADDAAGTADTSGAALTPGGAAAGGGAGEADAVPGEATTTGEEATTAASPEATGAPSPPGGYALDSRPAADGMLARIEYASPKTVSEVAEFYDSQIQARRRVELDVAGDDMLVYGLSSSTTVGPTTTAMDIERLLDQRSEPMVVVSPWTMQRDDPLIGELRDIGQGAQADALLDTRSKVTVIYAVR